MGILQPLSASSIIGVPFADYLNVTVPIEYAQDLRSDVLEQIEATAPVHQDMEGVHRLVNDDLRPTPAVFRFSRRGKVIVLSASGMALQAMRSMGTYEGYLRSIAAFPHRVSMLHVTADYIVPDPSDFIQMVKSAGQAEEVYLTRKVVKKERQKALLVMGFRGKETGTVYLGDRANADVWAKVYDKQQERVSKGFSDPGSIVRVEIAVQSDVGATLRDAYEPADLYYAHASRSLVEPPYGFNGWSPKGEGFALSPRREVLPLERLERLLVSQDVASLIELARECYRDKAGDVLSRLMRQKCATADAVEMSGAEA